MEHFIMNTQNEPSNKDSLPHCRACLSVGGRLFNIHQYKLDDAFARITGINVKKDTLQKYLCAYCGTQLLKSVSFRDMCLRSQQSLTLGKLDFDYIRKILPPNRLDLVLTEVKTIECIENPPEDIKRGPITNNENIFNEPITTNVNIINEPITTNENIIDEPITTNENIIDEPITTNENIIDEPITTNENIIDEPITTNENISIEPITNSVAIINLSKPGQPKLSPMLAPQRAGGSRKVYKPNINIAGIIKKSGPKTEFENQMRILNIPVEKLAHIQKTVKKIQNTIKKKIERANKDDKTNEAVKQGSVKMQVTKVGVKKNIETEIDDDVCVSGVTKMKLKRRCELKKNVETNKKRIDVKTLCKSESKNTRRVKKKMRTAENGYMPVFDFAKFESKYGVKIMVLSKEEQLEEIASRKKSEKYLGCPLQCEICGKGFITNTAYNNHLKKHDVSEGEYVCEVCTMRYKYRFKLQLHRDSHRLKFMCTECNFVSRRKGQAQDHHDMHKGKKYQCQYCGKTYIKKSTYFTHLRLMHAALCAACDQCGETFVSDYGLRLHKKRTHDEKQQIFNCTTCSATFISVEALNRHLETAGEHSDLRPCEQCGENCASEDALHEHVKERHPKETHGCGECNMTFPSSSALHVHIRRKHLNQGPSLQCKEYYRKYSRKYAARRAATLGKPARASASASASARASETSDLFMCDQCGRVLKNAAILRYHLQQHQGVKTFACHLCPKSYPMNATLKVHLRTHTGERPFQCADCPLAFNIKPNLVRHHKTAHQGIRDNFPCTVCGRVLTTKSSLQWHVKTVHQGQPWPKRDRSKRPGSGTTAHSA